MCGTANRPGVWMGGFFDWFQVQLDSKDYPKKEPGKKNCFNTNIQKMVLQVTTANNVKVYTVSGGLGSRSIPDWLVRQKKKALKKDFGTLKKIIFF